MRGVILCGKIAQAGYNFDGNIVHHFCDFMASFIDGLNPSDLFEGVIRIHIDIPHSPLK